MSHFTGYGAYMLFLALKTHFNNEKYDFFQMNGKLRATKESYFKRNDKWFFEKIAKEHTAEELRDFYLANLLEDKQYITELINEEAAMVYIDYQRRQQSLSYVCTNDMDRIFCDDDLARPFITSKDRYPDVITLFLRKSITLESLIIIDDLTGFTDKFDKFYEDDIIWCKISRKISKYRPFLKYDKVKMKNMLKGKVNEQRKETKEIPAERSAY